MPETEVGRHKTGRLNILKYSICRAKIKDAGNLANMVMELFKLEKDFIGDILRIRKVLRMLIKQGDKKSVVMSAMSKGKIVGMATGQMVFSTAAGAGSVLLEDVFIKPGFRRRGIGMKLVSAVEAWGKNNKAKRLQLVVDGKNNRAKLFYFKTGWKPSKMMAMYKVV